MQLTSMERENIVFLDIETVPQNANFSDIPEPLQHFVGREKLPVKGFLERK